ncbi:MAG: hypothetical protein D6776_01470, partial [Planctomycetota bacterium]
MTTTAVTTVGRARQLVQRIEHALRTPRHNLDRDALEPVAREYAELCTLVSERLARCQEFALRGLHAEVVALCEASPDALELLAALDIPALDDWIALCHELGLPAPTPLPLEAAELLNDTYARHEALRKLLDLQRRLVLARAPLARRLPVLRALAARDPENPHWARLLASHETARLEEIRASAQRAAASDDLETLEALLRELEDEGWRERPPAALQKQIANACRRVRDARTVAELEALLPEIEDAFGAMDLEQLAQLHDRWQALADALEGALPGELAERSRTAFSWLEAQRAEAERQRTFEQASEALRRAIETDAPEPELRQRYLEATRLGLELDPALERRYRERLEVHALRQRRNRRNRTIVLTAAALALAGALVLIARDRLRARRIEQAASHIGAALDQNRLEEASGLWEQLARRDPALLAAPELAGLEKRLAQAQEAERARRKRFQAALERAHAALERGAFAATHEALQAARDAARTDTEQQALAALGTQLAAAEQRRQRGIDERFERDARALLDEILALEPATMERDMERFSARLQALRRRHAALATRRDVSPELHKLLEPARLRLEALAKAREDRIARRKADEAERIALQNLPRLAHDAERYAEALQQLLERYPDSGRADAFRAALANARAWKAAQAWFRLVGPWADMPLPPSVASAEQRAEALERYLQAYPKTPWAQPAREIVAYYRRLAEIAARRLERFAAVRKLLNLPLLASVEIVTDKGNGKRYYLAPRQPVFDQGDRLSLPVLRSTNVEKWERIRLPKDRIEGPAPSPQARLAGRLHQRLDLYRPDEEPRFWLRFAKEVAAAHDVDPVLRAALLARVLPYAVEDTWGAEQQVAEWVARLQDRKVVPWVDPDDLEARLERERMETLLASFDFDAALARSEAARRRVEQRMRELFVHVLRHGVLMRSDDLRSWHVA